MRRHERSKPGNRKRKRHTMPNLQDFKAEVNGAKFFSKIDLKQAYHQLELHEDSRFINRDYFMVGECVRFLFTSCEGSLNERVSAANE